jgi:hypothetical protein
LVLYSVCQAPALRRVGMTLDHNRR